MVDKNRYLSPLQLHIIARIFYVAFNDIFTKIDAAIRTMYSTLKYNNRQTTMIISTFYNKFTAVNSTNKTGNVHIT